MGTFTWDGSTDTDPTDADNWAELGAPTLSSGGTDDLVFSGTPGYPCTFGSEFYCNSITIADDMTAHRGPIFNANGTLKGATPLVIKTAGAIHSASTSVITFTGTPSATRGYVDFYCEAVSGDITLNTLVTGMFDTTTSRGNMTFKFKPGANCSIVMQDGVYPHVEIDTDSSTVYFSPTYTASFESNAFGKVEILGFNSDAPINPLTRNEVDLSKEFHINGTLVLQMDVSATASVVAHRNKIAMDWGLSTIKFTPNADAWYLPVNGDANRGPSATVGYNTFNTKYHILKIGKSTTASHYVSIRPNLILNSYSLEIENGGRFFGSLYGDLNSVEIHTVRSPKIYGDWNFTQIAEGIYRSRGNAMRLPVSSGGTGIENVAKNSIMFGQGHGALGKLAVGSAGDVLAVNSGATALEWSSSAGGGGDAFDSIAVAGQTSLAASAGDDLTLVAAGGMTITTNAVTDTITLTSANDNTTYSVMASGNSYAAGLVAAGNGTHGGYFLRKDGTWVIPPDTGDTTYSVMASGNSYVAGLVAAGNATHGGAFLRQDGTWVIPPDTTTNTVDMGDGFKIRDDDDDDLTITENEYIQFVAATGALGTNLAGAGTTGDPYVMTITSPDTTTNTQTTYTPSVVDSTDDALIRLTAGGAGSGTQDIKLVAGSHITLTPDATTTPHQISIIAANDNTQTTYSTSVVDSTGIRLRLTAAGAGSGDDDVVFAGSGATSVARTDASTITISSTDNNTTYDVMASGNSYAAGLVAAGHGTHSGNFLRKDGTWAIPPDTTTDTIDMGSGFKIRDDDDDDLTVIEDKYLKFVAATGALGTDLSGTGTTGDPFLMTITSPDTTTDTIDMGDGFKIVDSGNDNEDVQEGEYVKFATATGSLATNLTGAGTSGNPFLMTLTSPNDNTQNTYTATTNGGLGLSSYAFSLDIDGMTDIGEALVGADLIIVDNGAGGTNRKSTITRLQTYMQGALTFTTNTNTNQLTTFDMTDSEGTPNTTTVSQGEVITFVASGAAGVTLEGTDNRTVTITATDTNTTYSAFAGSTTPGTAALVPARDGGATTTKYLREDGDWVIPPDVNTTTTADVLSALNADWGTDKTFGTQADDRATFTGHVTVSGDLTVSGDTFQQDVATFTVEDPLIELARSNAADAVDIGFYGKYTDSGAKYSGLFRDASDSDKWKLFATTGNSHEVPSATTVNTTTGFTLGTLVASTFEGALTGNVTGDVSGSSGSTTGNAASVTTNANLTGDITSVGNATVIASGVIIDDDVKADAAIAYSKLGTVPTWNQNTSGTATIATTVTVSDNENTNEENAIVFTAGADEDGGNLGLEQDHSGMTYNPSVGKITATAFAGALTGNVTGDASGSSGSCTGNSATATLATTATNVTVADESSDTSCNVLFTTAATGNLPPKSGTNLTFNSSSGLLTATLFAGDITGDVTGNADTATALETARNIGGVSFNGTGDITLPGVNSAGNQNTSGNAATATTSTNLIAASNTENESQYVAFLDNNNTSAQQVCYDTGVTYNPSTNALTTTGSITKGGVSLTTTDGFTGAAAVPSSHDCVRIGTTGVTLTSREALPGAFNNTTDYTICAINVGNNGSLTDKFLSVEVHLAITLDASQSGNHSSNLLCSYKSVAQCKNGSAVYWTTYSEVGDTDKFPINWKMLDISGNDYLILEVKNSTGQNVDVGDTACMQIRGNYNLIGLDALVG